MNTRTKVAVIGWDSATFEVLQPLVAQGALPNVEKCISRGLSGILRSTIHPLTPPAWASFMTGVNPGRHGIFDFIGLESDGKFHLTRGSDIRYPTLWSRLSNAGKKVVVMNVPMTYPPEELNGLIIAGMDSPLSNQPTTYPPELSQKIQQEFGQFSTDVKARAQPNQSVEEFTRQYTDELCKLVHTHGNIACRLVQEEQPDFLCVVFVQPDRIQHALGDLIELGVTQDDGIGQVYRALDEELGKLMELLDENWTIFIVSDHGACTYHRVFELDTWLAREGWLTVRKPTVIDTWTEAASLLQRNVARKLGLSVTRGAGFHAMFNRIQWQQTKAFSIGAFGSIYLNTKDRFAAAGTVERNSSEYESICSKITEGLLRFRDPESGHNVVRNVYRADQIYHGPYVSMAPDLLVDTTEEYFIRNNLEHNQGLTIYPAGRYGKRSLKHTARHTMEGIFVVSGCGVAATNEPSVQADIIDIAPTILHLFDIAVPADMDGRVCNEWFPKLTRQPQTSPATIYSPMSLSTDEKSSYSDIENEQLAQRLRDLGYLD